MSNAECQKLGHTGPGPYCNRCGKHMSMLAAFAEGKKTETTRPEPPKAVKVGCGCAVTLAVLVVVVGIIGAVVGEPTDDKAQVATSEPTQTLPPGEISRDALTLRAALLELTYFKDEPWFHVFCYSNRSPAHQWAEYVKDMNPTYNETGILPGELWSMGVDYCQNEGVDTDYTRWLLQKMDPTWLNLRPVPTPIAALRVTAERPFADLAEELAKCSWRNPLMQDLFGEEMAFANSIEDLALLFEAALEDGTRETWEGAITALTVCQNTGG